MKPQSRHFLLCLTLAVGVAAAAADATDERPAAPRRALYAVSQSGADRGSISVYDIDAGHRLVKRISTVANVKDVKGVVASAVTGRLYVAYRDDSRTGTIYSLNLYDDRIVWVRSFSPGVDRLAINPDGTQLYVPTWEENTADFINVVDAATGEVVRRVRVTSRSHDALYPLSGPLFQEAKADDGSGAYLYLIDPKSYAVSRVGPYADILGPYAVDSASRYVVNNVTHLWGMQIADLKTGRIVRASVADHPVGDPGLLHGIGWTPDQSEVWESGAAWDPVVYVWDMADPMAPRLQQKLPLKSGRGSHWLTFSIDGDYGYIAPNKGSDDGTEIFDARRHVSVGTIGSSEDMLEIDFTDGKVSRVGSQYGIGRK